MVAGAGAVRLRWNLLALLVVARGPSLGLAQPSERIRSLVAAGTVEGMRSRGFGVQQSGVREFYESGGYAAAWFQ